MTEYSAAIVGPGPYRGPPDIKVPSSTCTREDVVCDRLHLRTRTGVRMCSEFASVLSDLSVLTAV